MTENKIKEQIQKLIELQKIDGQVYEFKKELEEKPKEVQALKEQFEAKKTRLHELEENLKKTVVARKDLEVDMKTKEDQIVKANSQLSQVKKNEEYKAKLSEIEHIKADKSVIEEKILLSYDDSDQIQAEINKEKQHVAQEEKQYLDRKKEVDDYVRTVEGKVAQLKTQRQEIIPHVAQDVLVRYERVLNHKDGIAVVPINGHTCGGCFLGLNPQVINEVKMGEKMVECEVCSRILYLKENL
ncbi:MAG: hypothetical protein HQL24_05000 [Candidatus Omnitrophica bacterium]|nr:hypothetical protein [Candidatus Omnitrophota bacterium]